MTPEARSVSFFRDRSVVSERPDLIPPSGSRRGRTSPSVAAARLRRFQARCCIVPADAHGPRRHPKRAGSARAIVDWHCACPRAPSPVANDIGPGSAAVGPSERSAETGHRPAAACMRFDSRLSMRASAPYAPALHTQSGDPAGGCPHCDPRGSYAQQRIGNQARRWPASRRGRPNAAMLPAGEINQRLRLAAPHPGVHPCHDGDDRARACSLAIWPVSRSRRGTPYSCRVRAAAANGPAWRSS